MDDSKVSCLDIFSATKTVLDENIATTYNNHIYVLYLFTLK
jgi:hypothetical protein